MTLETVKSVLLNEDNDDTKQLSRTEYRRINHTSYLLQNEWLTNDPQNMSEDFFEIFAEEVFQRLFA